MGNAVPQEVERVQTFAGGVLFSALKLQAKLSQVTRNQMYQCLIPPASCCRELRARGWLTAGTALKIWLCFDPYQDWRGTESTSKKVIVFLCGA